jgi:hypothetical protein
MTEVLRAAHPSGSQFKGYEPYQVQELVLTARVRIPTKPPGYTERIPRTVPI